MTISLEATSIELTEIQRKAVEWNDGPLLVLGGFGSGKTRVLTCRIVRLLEESPRDRFRILALTSTNKAAHEIKTRVASLVTDHENRLEINTFHGFCAQVLRQHGTHLGIKSNFEIFPLASDRASVLADALRRSSDRFGNDNIGLMSSIDDLKARLILPNEAAGYLADRTGIDQNLRHCISLAYQLYEDELRRSNALDCNSLILEAYRLFEFPALVHHYQTVFRYWHIDEFQNINTAQYALFRRMGGCRISPDFFCC